MQTNQQAMTNQTPPQPKISNQSSQPVTDKNSTQFSVQLKKNPSLQLYGSRIPLGDSHQQSMASLQTMESSESVLTQSLPNQTFPIYYNNNIFLVDPIQTSKSSLKFKELIEPYLSNTQPLTNLRLNIADNVFTIRNMENFLKLCQNLPTDVNNDEMKEICEIAKMFQANKIYDKGLQFIQTSLDPNFFVPDNKYDESNGKKYLFITMINQNKEHIESDEMKSVIYQLKIENRGLKKPIYRFYSQEKLLFSAKGNSVDFFIVEGHDVHIEKNKSNHIGQIHQHSDGYNLIRARDLKYKLSYVNSGKPNDVSIEVSFPFNGTRANWSPKNPVYDPVNDKYLLNLGGNYHRVPIKSSRNIVLQDSDGHATFIARKMDQKTFEIECLPVIDPLIAFEIGLSDVIGPFTC